MPRVNDVITTAPAPMTDGDSDYGSDIDPDTWDRFCALAESQPLQEVAIESIEDPMMQGVASQSGRLLRSALRPRHGPGAAAATPLAPARELAAYHAVAVQAERGDAAVSLALKREAIPCPSS